MVNYGYTCKGWGKRAKTELANALRQMIADFGFKEQESSLTPYVENDAEYPDAYLYEGVRIRRITHLSDEDSKKIVIEADKIYEVIKKKWGY